MAELIDCPRCKRQTPADGRRCAFCGVPLRHAAVMDHPRLGDAQVLDAAPMGRDLCGLCGKEIETGSRLAQHYGLLACRRCSSGLIHRRQAAFALDFVIWMLLLGVASSLFGLDQAETGAMSLLWQGTEWATVGLTRW
jgi:hypothetical protein